MAKKNGEKKARVEAAINIRDAAEAALKLAEKALGDTQDRVEKDLSQARQFKAAAKESKSKIKGLRSDIKRERGKLRDARKGVAQARKG